MATGATYNEIKQVKIIMEENYYLDDCGDNDILSFGDYTVKVSQFRAAIKEAFQGEIPQIIDNALKAKNINLTTQDNFDIGEWFGQLLQNNPEIGQILLQQGIDCQLIKPNQAWQQGKVRIKVSLEFCPEGRDNKTSDSSLDDIRRNLNK